MIDNQERKQFKLMQYFLSIYLQNAISLRELITKLDHLVRQTTSVAPWEKFFFDNLLTLESFSIEDPTEEAISPTYKLEMINQSVNNLTQLVDDLLSSYEQVSDISVKSTAQELDAKWLLCPLCIDAWENDSTNAMVICPKCNEALHNPRHIKNRIEIE